MATNVPYQPLIIYPTRNYGMFSYDYRNRPIKPKKLQGLIEKVRAHNRLIDNPILVSNTFLILDGQHRTKAAEALQVEIYFHLAQATTFEDVPAMNSDRDDWMLTNYLRLWVESRSLEYLKLRDFMHEFPFITLHLAVYMTAKTRRNTEEVLDAFHYGYYEAAHLDFARSVAHHILDFKPYFPDYPHSYFVRAMVALAKQGYDHDRLMRKMSLLGPGKLFRSGDVGGYLGQLSYIYNYKTQKSSYVDLTDTGKPKRRGKA